MGSAAAVNAVCPYLTMFPISFPYKVLSQTSNANEAVLDPFCGRGTTNLAARLLGLPSVGIDSNRLAVALTQAKLISAHPESIVAELDDILDNKLEVQDTPSEEFWNLAYERSTLEALVRIRSALLLDCTSPERIALRAIILGALHGPKTKGEPSYLSNQCPRTYAPKPRYAASFWQKTGLRPNRVDLRSLVSRKARRYFGYPLPKTDSKVLLGDSRSGVFFDREMGSPRFDWIITSPPYYGLRTYNPDQWLRLWFLGGPSSVDYSQSGQIAHDSPESFVTQLASVWRNCASVSKAGARLVIRFGRINDRPVEHFDILRESLRGSGWRIQTRKDAGTAASGKRQAQHFGVRSKAQRESDIWAIKVA